MSIQTGEIPSYFLSGKSVTILDSFASEPDSEALEIWENDVKQRFISTDDTGDEFLSKYVPSATSYAFAPVVTGNQFANYKLAERGQADTYASFIAGLNALVSPFPAEKQASFLDCHTKVQPFPYSAFAAHHHASHPSIAVSFPGRILDSQTLPPDWSNISMFIQLRAETGNDPLRHCSKIRVQLAVDGRNLLHAHSSLTSFVIGVYGDIFRVYLFDHSGAVVSKALSLPNVDDLLHQFFWRFAHPTEGNSVIGCDPTVRRLTPEDEKWLKDRLELVGVGVEDIVFSEVRRAEVFDKNDLATSDPPPAYMLLRALDVNARLFSRATIVWLGIRDTRRLDLKVRIVKDTWRPLARRPETDFYTRLSRIPSDERIGLPSLVCGGDLAEREIRGWESQLYGAPTPRKLLNPQARLTTPPTATASSAFSIAPLSLIAVSTGPNLPSHRPLQQTFTWRQARGAESWQGERSHVRFVVDKVGRSLNRFWNTREMVTAIRDAIRGHRIAMSRAMILHRDISINNILILDEPENQAFFGGFIHDFDYSSMSRKAPVSSLAFFPGLTLTELLGCNVYGDELKEKRGTFYFLAVMLLSDNRSMHAVRHDLESFYWVLLWTILRHTAHNHPDGQNTCSNIFKLGSEASFGSKMDFGDLCFCKAFSHVNPLDYDHVLALFDKTLDSDEYKALWPEDDPPLKYDLPDARIEDRERKRKRKAKKARGPGPDSETDMDNESTDFELYDDIDKEDGPTPVMPPYYDDDEVNVIVPADYAHLLEIVASPSLRQHVHNTPSPGPGGNVSFVEACQVEAMLDFSEPDDSADVVDRGPDSSPVRKGKMRRRTATTPDAQPSPGSTKASATQAGASGNP